MLYRYKVPLFAFQSFLCPSDLSARPCPSLPLSCKCYAYPELSAMITAFVVYQT
jgi:hypothetical protein